MATMVTYTKVHTANRGTSTYKAPGRPGVILFAKPMWNGEHPETIEVADVPEATESARVSKAKMSPEEKKVAAAAKRAELAALTPAERLERKIAKATAVLAAAQAKREAAQASA